MAPASSSSAGARAIWRPSGSRAITGAPATAPSSSRITVAATTVARVAWSTSSAVSTADPSIRAWAAAVSPRWKPPGGGVGAVEAEGVLGDEPSEPGGQPETIGLPVPEEVGEGGDGVGGVVVARSPEVGESAGDGQPSPVVGGDAQGLGGQLHGRGEARVEVDQLDVVDADPGTGGRGARRCLQRAAPAAAMPGDRPGSGRAAGNRTSVASAPAQTKTARSATPARRAAASEQTTRAAPWSEPRKAVISLV